MPLYYLEESEQVSGNGTHTLSAHEQTHTHTHTKYGRFLTDGEFNQTQVIVFVSSLTPRRSILSATPPLISLSLSAIFVVSMCVVCVCVCVCVCVSMNKARVCVCVCVCVYEPTARLVLSRTHPLPPSGDYFLALFLSQALTSSCCPTLFFFFFFFYFFSAPALLLPPPLPLILSVHGYDEGGVHPLLQSLNS
jgi:hypothetical protein